MHINLLKSKSQDNDPGILTSFNPFQPHFNPFFLPEDITVVSSEIVEEVQKIKEDSPVPPDEAAQLLKIVDDHDKQEIDNHLIASSRLMLKRQLRQDTVDREAISDLLKVPKSSNGSGETSSYNGDRTDYRSPTYSNSSSTYDR